MVAGGAVQTPALLARSGLKSRSGQLGRNLTLHPNAKVIAFFDEEVTGWHGVHQAFQVREFMREGILITAVNLAPSLVALGLPAYGRELGELMADYNHMISRLPDRGHRDRPGPQRPGPRAPGDLSDRRQGRRARGPGRGADG